MFYVLHLFYLCILLYKIVTANDCSPIVHKTNIDNTDYYYYYYYYCYY